MIKSIIEMATNCELRSTHGNGIHMQLGIL